MATGVMNYVNIYVDVSTYWTKWTLTCSTDDIISNITVYANGTEVGFSSGPGKLFRWSESATLILGGYPLSGTEMTSDERFIGWIDDLAFYNRAWSAAEVSQHWAHAGNANDQSLVLYYTFDEGPGATVFKNSAFSGSQGDLSNGNLVGRPQYFESVTRSIRSVSPALSVRYDRKNLICHCMLLLRPNNEIIFFQRILVTATADCIKSIDDSAVPLSFLLTHYFVCRFLALP